MYSYSITYVTPNIFFHIHFSVNTSMHPFAASICLFIAGSIELSLGCLIALHIHHWGIYGLCFFLWHCAFNSYIMAVATHAQVPWILGKDHLGQYKWWSYVLFYPYMLGYRIAVFLRRFDTKETLFEHIVGPFYLGGWIESSHHFYKVYDPRVKNIPELLDISLVDLTIELPRLVSFNQYYSLQCADAGSPTMGEIDKALHFVMQRFLVRDEKIWITCAFGHGRSASFLVIVLVTLGVVADFKEAYSFLRSKRKTVNINSFQRWHVEEYLKTPFALELKNTMTPYRELLNKDL